MRISNFAVKVRHHHEYEAGLKTLPGQLKKGTLILKKRDINNIYKSTANTKKDHNNGGKPKKNFNKKSKKGKKGSKKKGKK